MAAQQILEGVGQSAHGSTRSPAPSVLASQRGRSPQILTIVIAREVDAAFYVTFHHKGVIEGRETFLQLLDAFHEVIPRRHAAMLEYLSEPHTIDEMVAHRFIYRPHVEHVFADSVERRCADMHLARMLERGEATEVSTGRFQAV